MRDRRFLLGFGIMSMLILFVLAAGPRQVLAKEAKEVTFGILTPLSGPAAMWGIASSRSIILNAQKINEEGGFTVNGQPYKWNVVIYDHKYVPAEAVKAANKAIYNDKAKFLSILGGSAALACLQLMKENKILSLNPAGGGKALTNPKNPLVFRYNSAIHAMYSAFLPVLIEREKIKTMAVINPDDATGRSGLAAAKWAANLVNIEIVNEAFFERGIKDFSPLLTRVIAKNPDLIETSYTSPTSAALICKQARELGYKGVILLSWGPDVKDVIKIGGENANNAYLMSTGPLVPQTPAQKEFYNRFVKQYPASDWDALYWHHTEMIPFLTKGIVETQSFDPYVLAKHFESMKCDSPVGTLRFGGSKIFGTKRQLLFPDSLIQIQNGKPVFIGTPPIPEGVMD